MIKTDILLFQYCGDITAAAQTVRVRGAGPDGGDARVVRAAPGDASVALAWRTASELDNLGFHLYRALRPTAVRGRGSRRRSFPASGRRRSGRPTPTATGACRTGRATSTGSRTSTRRRRRRRTAPSRRCPWPRLRAARRAASLRRAARARSRRAGVLAVVPRLGGGGLRLRGRRLGVLGRAHLHAPRRPRGGVPGRRVARLATGDARAQDRRLLRAPRGLGHGAGLRPRLRLPAGPAGSGAALAARARGRGRRTAGPARRGARARAGGLPGPRARRRSARRRCRSRGTARCARAGGRCARTSPLHVSADLARLLPSVFQGETKSAVVVLTPLRYDARRQQIVLAKRVLVRLLFTGRETGGERAGQPRAGSQAPRQPASGELLAPSLHGEPWALRGVASRSCSPGGAEGSRRPQLRLERQGQAVGLPRRAGFGDRFGPGSRAVLLRRRIGGLDAVLGRDGVGARARETVSRCRYGTATRGGGARLGASSGRASLRERTASTSRACSTRRTLWLWEALASGATRAKSFSLTGVRRPAPGALRSRSSCRVPRSRGMPWTTT